MMIAKNASSSLREVFGKPKFDSFESYYAAIDNPIRERYYTFSFLRHPVTRLLSAYQEISWRIDHGYLARDAFHFSSLDDNLARFNAFLDEVDASPFDPHVKHQADYIRGARLDFLGIVERLDDDMEKLCGALSINPFPTLPCRRSRQERMLVNGYTDYYLDEEELHSVTRQRILDLYAEDIDLYKRTHNAV